MLLSVKRAAEERAVARTTLQDKILGNVIHGTKPGPQQYLTKLKKKNLLSITVIVGT